MDQKQALKVILAAADLVGRMLEDELVNKAVAYLTPLTEDGPINRPTLRNMEWIDQSTDWSVPTGNFLLSAAQILDATVHLQAIRVKRNAKGVQMAHTKGMQAELDKVYALYEVSYSTTQIPGYTGDFVVYAHPYGD